MEDRRDNDRRKDTFRDDDNRRLFRLHELDDYKVASDDPDVRGWEIYDRDKQRFGVVKELIVDPEQERVRYLDVEPSRDVVSGGRDERLLIPIGAARLDEDNNKIVVNEVDRKILNAYPLYKGDVVDRDYEVTVVERFNRPSGSSATTPGIQDFYSTPMYDEDRFYTNRDRNNRR